MVLPCKEMMLLGWRRQRMPNTVCYVDSSVVSSWHRWRLRGACGHSNCAQSHRCGHPNSAQSHTQTNIVNCRSKERHTSLPTIFASISLLSIFFCFWGPVGASAKACCVLQTAPQVLLCDLLAPSSCKADHLALDSQTLTGALFDKLLAWD